MAQPSIPASALISDTPGVISAGGSQLSLTGLCLTQNSRVPVGAVASFPSLATVQAYFGASAAESLFAGAYFAGDDGSTQKPGSLLFMQYPNGRVPAYLRGGNVGAALGLTGVQALSAGTLTMTIDGVTATSSSINLSSATSLSNAASLIATALNIADASFTGALANSTGVLTVTALTGTLANGQTLSGAGVPAGILIGSQVSGTAGSTGTYNTNYSGGAVSAEAMQAGLATVSYDSQSGGFIIQSGSRGITQSTITFPTTNALATSLMLTQATGAVLSQGANGGSPAAAMAQAVSLTSNWASFTTLWEAVTADAVSFAQWNGQQNSRYLYVEWNTDIVNTQNPNTGSFSAALAAAGYAGCNSNYAPVNGYLTAAAVMGWAASLNFNQTGGRRNLHGRQFSQAGLQPDVTGQAVAAQLTTNGMSFYGAYGTGAAVVSLYTNGFCSGPFGWADSYVNQINLNSALQAAELNLLTVAGSIPFNDVGATLIEEAASGPIQAALAFGSIQPGVPLSAVQAQEVNNLAGLIVDPIVYSRGWYFSCPIPSPTVRATRGPWPATLFYTDGQSLQSLSLFSEEVA